MTEITKEELYSIIRARRVMKDAGTTFVVVDNELKVLYVNYTSVDEEHNVSPGDLIKCHNAFEAKMGCGTHENCRLCKLRNMVKASLATMKKMNADVEFLLCGNKDCDAHVVSTPFEHKGKRYSIVLFVDRTDQHREFMMEQIFLHDILNLSGALSGIMDCMDDNPKEMIHIVKGISKQLLNEIIAQRDFIYAKNGMLKPKRENFRAEETVDFVRDNLVFVALDMWGVTLDIESAVGDEQVFSDKALVNRVVHNMVKNACEASRGSTVTLRCRVVADKVVFSVHNDAVMSDEVKSKVFLYGNSTKGSGRGFGTYSMKLIGENYLKGKVWFKSEEGFGTEFYFELDKVK